MHSIDILKIVELLNESYTYLLPSPNTDFLNLSALSVSVFPWTCFECHLYSMPDGSLTHFPSK